jgi:uncharacterized membrane protein
MNANYMIILCIIIAVVIVIHHIIIHTEYSFPDRAFQISDICNHETWVVAALACAVGIAISSKL